MNSLLTSSMLLFVLIVVSCNSEKESDLFPDCTESNLSVTIESFTNARCNTLGSVALTASGGQGGYEYSRDGVNFQQDNVFPELSAGSYTFTVKDLAECLVTISATVASANGGVVGEVTSSTEAGCGNSNGQVMIAAQGGDGTYEYSLNGGEFVTSGTFTNLEAGSYSFAIKDGEGCSDDGSFKILSGTSLDQEVFPIIEANCAVTGCHGTSQSPLLDTKAKVIASASGIQSRTSAGTMPPAGRIDLTQEQIDLIACWVEDGARDN